MNVSPATAQSVRWRRAILFRALAILLAFTPFLAAEVILRACGIGQPDLHDDLYVGFSHVNPLFELDQSGERYEIARSRQQHFVPDSFAARKAPDVFRIFCIGDSTVQGNPWSIETSFTTWLKLNLKAADRSRRWEVVNCGGISYASYRMVPILEEILQYQPDLIIVHCSHNEFLEDRTYGDLGRRPSALMKLHSQVSQLRICNVLRAATWSTMHGSSSSAARANTNRTVLANEVQALLDHQGGLEFYHHDANWQRGVIAHYEFNLRRMTAIARQAGVRLLLMNPACNLRDSPPFKVEHRESLTEQEQIVWDHLWSEARSLYAGQPSQAIKLIQQAFAIDDQHAGMHYDLAKYYDSLGRSSDARMEYLRAKELDVCPLRILQPMNDIVLQVGRETNTPVVDINALFQRISRNGIPGSDWFADHVHPTIPGYQRIADEIVNELVDLNIVCPVKEWELRKKQAYAAHFDALPNLYFLQAQERLQALMKWANGRVTGIPK